MLSKSIKVVFVKYFFEGAISIIVLPKIYKTNIMKSIIQLFLFLIISSANAQDLNDYITQYAENGKELGIRSNFNGVVLVAKDNKILLNKAYGFSNMENKEPLTSDSKFLIGSLTKPFVSLLVMQQVEKGTIKLNQPITDFLPYMDKEKGKYITIHGLLSNSSGLPHYEGLRGHVKDMRTFSSNEYTPEEYAKLIDKTGLSAKPNSKFQYSSLGYVLLGAVLEEVTGQSFSQLIENYIAKPLELKNTGFKKNDFLTDSIVKDYRLKKDAYVEFPNRNQSNTYTAGGMHSTAKDLFTWSQALKSREVLGRKNTKKMFKSNFNGYAYGWMRNDIEVLKYVPQARFYSHSGSVNGFSTYMMLNDDGTTIIVLCNTTPIQPFKLIADIYRKQNNEDLDISTRVILPSFKSVEEFNKEGGLEGIKKYHTLLSQSASYPVYPSSRYLAKVAKMYIKANIDSKGFETLLLELIKDNQDAEDLINRIGYAYMKSNSKKTLDYFKMNTGLFPKSPNVWDSLGDIYEESEKPEDALKAYTKALELAKIYFHTDLMSFENHLKKLNEKLSKK
jgi:CubicO group peptidase (beta-lactamase class C family)